MRPPGQAVPDVKSVVVNGLLVQNLIGAPSPNRSFWSIAVEAQLYLVFPLLLLMVRRSGAIVMVAAVTLLVATVGILGPHISRVDAFDIQSPPDLAALFAIGVVSAGIVGVGSARRSWPWGRLALAAAAPVVALIWWRGSVWTLDHLFWVDLTLGPAVACLLVGLATGRPAPLVRLLDTRPLRSLGASSYSLYLTHGPIVVVVYAQVVAGRVRPGVPAFVVSLALALPLTIVSGMGSSRRSSRSRSSTAAAGARRGGRGASRSCAPPAPTRHNSEWGYPHASDAGSPHGGTAAGRETSHRSLTRSRRAPPPHNDT